MQEGIARVGSPPPPPPQFLALEAREADLKESLSEALGRSTRMRQQHAREKRALESRVSALEAQLQELEGAAKDTVGELGREHEERLAAALEAERERAMAEVAAREAELERWAREERDREAEARARCAPAAPVHLSPPLPPHPARPLSRVNPWAGTCLPLTPAPPPPARHEAALAGLRAQSASNMREVLESEVLPAPSAKLSKAMLGRCRPGQRARRMCR